jgi:hypothetical protein
LPQRPQCAGLVAKAASQPSTALALQSPKPALQVIPHARLAQVLVALGRAGHAAPHAPQWATLDVTSVSQPLAALPSQLPKFAPHVKPHTPEAHVAVALAGVAQTLPQRPQCEVEVSVRTSQPSEAVELQSPKPVWHTKPHTPDPHAPKALAGFEHTLPHMPQLARSVESVEHAPLHTVCPDGQLSVQLPAAHTCPLAHVRPHMPQLPLSVWRSRHVPVQLVCPGGQLTTHVPAVHTWPAEHTRPHIPQFERSVASVTHDPPHCVCPLGHDGTHAPLAQRCPLGHALPQRPQWFRSFWRSRHTPEHSVSPVAHVGAQTPEAHEVPVGQTFPQRPQLALSDWRSRHVPEQLVCPAAHDTRHAPIAHAVPAPHAVPQAPQLALSV